jgi:hypothetical protein
LCKGTYMTTPLLTQNAPSSVVTYLELQTGLPATGLLFSDVTVGLKKEGGSFLALSLTALNFTDLGNGFYEIELTAADVDTLGSLYLSFTGASIKTSFIVASVVVAASAPPVPPSPFTPQTTTIFGYIYGQNGSPSANVSVLVRTITKPAILHPQDQGILITEKFITTSTDASGFFSLDLLTGTQVEVLIADANYRRVLTVPVNSSNLFDIP